MIIKCKKCSKDFIGRKERKYCSKECYYKSIPDILGKREKRNCIVCGKEFYVQSSSTKKLCSLKCRNNYLWKNQEYRNHMSEVHKGKKWGERQREIMREIMIGNSYGFKKGNTPHNKGKGSATPYQRHKNSKKHKQWREEVFKRDNYTCQICGKRSGNGKRVELNADHIKPYAIYPNLRYDVSNGRTVCLECHHKTETFGGNIIRIKKEQLVK